MTLPLGATWEQHLEWCEREMEGLRRNFADRGEKMMRIKTRRLVLLQAEAARCREEIIKAKGRER